MLPAHTLRLPTTVVLFTIVACGGGGARPAPPASAAAVADAGAPPLDRAALAEIADGLQEVLATMAAIVEQAPDCGAMAHQLGELFDRSEPLFGIAKTQGADPVAGPVLTQEMDARAAAVAPVVERISDGLARCRGDESVVEVMKRMPTL